MNKFSLLTVFALLLVCLSCKKQQEEFSSATLNDYFPLAVGKSFLYRMDSIVPANAGQVLATHAYIAKDSIESTFTDNQGRQSYRIFRFIRDTAQTQSWQFAATYVATPDKQWLEYNDNNMRFLKLHLPIRDGYSWKAHSFIDTKSLNSPVPYLDEWEYEYRNLGATETVLGNAYQNTVTVFQQDETTPEGPFDPSNYQQRNYGVEVYAKGIGLVYKNFLHWTWQTTPNGHYEDDSYGLKLELISYK